MKLTTDVVVVGAGPAGLCAAQAARCAGAEVTIVDEHARPGGQLVKQVHKFFGSHTHHAGVRGVDIARKLVDDVCSADVDLRLNTVAWSIHEGLTLGLFGEGQIYDLAAKKVILSTGATENAISFPGWTLPGVMGAGAAQTLVNLHRVLPGKRCLIVGAGNVGLIVAYQMIQAGAEVVAVVEASGRIGGYAVHASKLRRNSVPIYVRHTVVKAEGKGRVERAVIAEVDDCWQPLPESEKVLDVETICIATGLSPLAELAWMMGCEFVFSPKLGGFVPSHDKDMRTSHPDIFIAGDVAGIEEASAAMDEGTIAGVAAAASLGYRSETSYEKTRVARENLRALRQGPFGNSIATAKEAIWSPCLVQ